MKSLSFRGIRAVRIFPVLPLVLAVPALAIAQSPFDTGAQNLITDFQSFATPVAAIIVIALGIAALAGRISWGWPIGAIAGIALIFGAPEIVAWVQGLFGFA